MGKKQASKSGSPNRDRAPARGAFFNRIRMERRIEELEGQRVLLVRVVGALAKNLAIAVGENGDEPSVHIPFGVLNEARDVGFAVANDAAGVPGIAVAVSKQLGAAAAKPLEDVAHGMVGDDVPTVDPEAHVGDGV